jgi:hypothetical protein
MSEEKVTGTVRKSLIKNGLVIIPIDQQIECKDIIKKDREGQDNLVGFLTTVNTKYKLIDIDTGEFEIIASSGQGVDTQDKGSGKGMTYSFKYALLRSFAIPTGDDPDKISSEELTKEQEKELEKAAKKTSNKVDTPEDAEKLLKEKFPGTKVEDYDKNSTPAATLADDKDVQTMIKRVEEGGKTSGKIIDALVRSYTIENKDTLLRILESKI